MRPEVIPLPKLIISLFILLLFPHLMPSQDQGVLLLLYPLLMPLLVLQADGPGPSVMKIIQHRGPR